MREENIMKDMRGEKMYEKKARYVKEEKKLTTKKIITLREERYA